MTWFENHWCARSFPSDRPPWYSPGFGQTTFLIVRTILVYGTLAALWYADGFITATVALVAYYSFSKISFRFYFNKELRRATADWVDFLTRDAESKHLVEDRESIVKKAVERATIQTVRNVQGKGPLDPY